MPYYPGTPFDDQIFASTRNDTITGGDGIDSIWALAGNDLVFGNGGNDHLYGYYGNDLMFGGAGHDSLHGEQDDDTLSGGSGNDTLSGGEGEDVLNGDSGDDVLRGGPGADTIDGGTGVDTVSYYNAAASVVVNLGQGTGSGGDKITNVENIYATAYADILVGNAAANRITAGGGNDIILGQGGNDVLLPGTGNDVVNGGTGFDIVSYEDYGSGNGFHIDLLEGSANRGNVTGRWYTYETDSLFSIEGAIGSEGQDTMTGNDAANSLSGNRGDDQIDGGAGNDTIDGGSGLDTVTGGAGADTFVFTLQDLVANGGPDWGVITDFSGNDGDRIDLGELSHWYGPLSFISDAAFSASGSAEVRIAQLGFGSAVVHVDLGGDGEPDGIIAVTVSDFDLLGAEDFLL
ncbi:MAG: calcium-binding protein [Roseovarius sp.]